MTGSRMIPGRGLELRSFQIRALRCSHADLLVFLNECRYLHHQNSLQLGGLSHIGNRCSIMAPLRRFLILAWMKPRKFPGVRWATLKTENRSLLNLTTMPGRVCVDEIMETNLS